MPIGVAWLISSRGYALAKLALIVATLVAAGATLATVAMSPWQTPASRRKLGVPPAAAASPKSGSNWRTFGSPNRSAVASNAQASSAREPPGDPSWVHVGHRSTFAGQGAV